MAFAHEGTAWRSYKLTVLPSRMCSNSLGTGVCPLSGSPYSLLSKTRSSVSSGRSSINLSWLRAYLSRTFTSGMSWPPSATRDRTRARCNSALSSPTYQMRTSIPREIALRSRAGIVFPPSVVSKTKSFRSSMALSSRRRPCSHAAPFAYSWLIPGTLARNFRAITSGLKNSTPACANIAPPILLFPAPFTPART